MRSTIARTSLVCVLLLLLTSGFGQASKQKTKIATSQAEATGPIAIVAPGTEDTLPGQDIFIQLDGKDRDQMILVRDIALALNFSGDQRRRGGRGEGGGGGGISNRFPSTRMGLATQLRQAFMDTQDYEAKLKAAENRKPESGGTSKGGGERQKSDLKLEALLPYLHGGKPVVIGARDGYDFEKAMRLA